ncbi:MAG: dTMP kinase [Clostridiales Family XIII bacterium]|nr:dTMP kinase [Clostridiales Family XIII bacterium]
MSLFITFEGGDGAGKSTQIKKLAEFFRNQGIPVVITREPGGTPIGEKIREVILDKENAEMEDTTEMFLYAAARAQLVREVIRPALLAGKVVICDRFLDSSIVYQGFGRGLGNVVQHVNEPAVSGISPNLTILLSLDTKAASERRKNSENDRIEAEGDSLQNKVREAYGILASEYKDRIVTIDASKGIDEISELIIEQVKARL